MRNQFFFLYINPLKNFQSDIQGINEFLTYHNMSKTTSIQFRFHLQKLYYRKIIFFIKRLRFKSILLRFFTVFCVFEKLYPA